MQLTIEISKELKETKSGVYMIGFSSGHYYIGGSKHLDRRIPTHICLIRGDFKSPSTPKSLRKMSGFEGIVTFSLLERVDVSYDTYGLPMKVLEREAYYKQKYYNEEFLLNITPLLV